MQELRIIHEPAKVLRVRSHEIENVASEEIQNLIPKMIQAMNTANGVGLAAPQIGKPIRLIIVSAKEGPLVCINPTIIKKSFRKEWMEEGCLSVPGSYGLVKRHHAVTVNFLNQKGESITLKAYGLLAQIFQHEVDHINGTLFIDKAKNLKSVQV